MNRPKVKNIAMKYFYSFGLAFLYELCTRPTTNKPNNHEMLFYLERFYSVKNLYQFSTY